MNKIQREIMNSLRYRSFMNYNSLWNKKMPSSQFAYHLKNLEKKGLVSKKEGGYYLTIEGIKFSDYLTMESPQPICVVVIIPRKENRVLVRTREKYPFKGYGEFCASKVKHNETILEAAKERLKSKLGMEGKLTYKGIEFLQTKEKDAIVMHHHLHIFLAEGLKGNPVDGEWVDIKGFSPKNPLPHISQTLKIGLGKGFSVAFSELMKKGDSYLGYKTQDFWKY